MLTHDTRTKLKILIRAIQQRRTSPKKSKNKSLLIGAVRAQLLKVISYETDVRTLEHNPRNQDYALHHMRQIARAALFMPFIDHFDQEIPLQHRSVLVTMRLIVRNQQSRGISEQRWVRQTHMSSRLRDKHPNKLSNSEEINYCSIETIADAS